MPKKAHQQPAKAAPASVPSKRPLVRSLKNLEDLRRLQAKLLKAFLNGELDASDFKTAMYGTTCLCATMRHLEPEPKPASWVSELIITTCEPDPETDKVIEAMNRNIMDAPEGNQ